MLGSIRVLAAGLALVLATVSSPRPAYGQSRGLDTLDAALAKPSQRLLLTRLNAFYAFTSTAVARSPAQPAGVLQSASQQP